MSYPDEQSAPAVRALAKAVKKCVVKEIKEGRLSEMSLRDMASALGLSLGLIVNGMPWNKTKKIRLYRKLLGEMELLDGHVHFKEAPAMAQPTEEAVH